jgi:hypothetical protein
VSSSNVTHITKALDVTHITKWSLLCPPFLYFSISAAVGGGRTKSDAATLAMIVDLAWYSIKSLETLHWATRGTASIIDHRKFRVVTNDEPPRLKASRPQTTIWPIVAVLIVLRKAALSLPRCPAKKHLMFREISSAFSGNGWRLFDWRAVKPKAPWRRAERAG